jgi:hypothetical protein
MTWMEYLYTALCAFALMAGMIFWAGSRRDITVSEALPCAVIAMAASIVWPITAVLAMCYLIKELTNNEQ